MSSSPGWDLKRQTNVLAINFNNIFNSPAVAIATVKHRDANKAQLIDNKRTHTKTSSFNRSAPERTKLRANCNCPFQRYESRPFGVDDYSVFRFNRALFFCCCVWKVYRWHFAIIFSHWNEHATVHWNDLCLGDGTSSHSVNQCGIAIKKELINTIFKGH